MEKKFMFRVFSFINEIIPPVYNFYSNKIIPYLGKKVANNKEHINIL